MAHYFLGIPLPNDIKAHLHELSKRFKADLDYGYWTDEADYHITLLFLGDAKPSQLEALKRSLHAKTGQMAGGDIKLKGFGTFGKKEQPRVLWMGIDYDRHLTELYEAAKESVASSGFTVDARPYRPHITIAKKWRSPSRIADIESLFPSFEPLSWKAKEYILFQVDPGKTPRYIPVESFTLI